MTRQGNTPRASDGDGNAGTNLMRNAGTNLMAHRSNLWQPPLVNDEELKIFPFKEPFNLQLAQSYMQPTRTSSNPGGHDLEEVSALSYMDLRERRRKHVAQQKGYNLLLPSKSPSSSMPSSSCASPRATHTPASHSISASVGTSSPVVSSSPVLDSDSLSELIMFPEISSEWKHRSTTARPRHPSNELHSNEMPGLKSFSISSQYSGSYLSSPSTALSTADSHRSHIPTERALVAVDDGSECVEALEYALSHGLLKNTRSITLFTVLHPLHYVPQGLANPSLALAWSDNMADRVLESSARDLCEKGRERRRKTLKRLEEVRNILKDEKQISVEMQIAEKHGPPGRHIVEAAAKMDAHRLILGRYKCSRILRTLTMEGISDYCIAKAPKNVQVFAVRRRKRGGYLVSDKNKVDFWVLA